LRSPSPAGCPCGHHPPEPTETTGRVDSKGGSGGGHLGLLAAWAIHDTEELLTMGGRLDRARPRLRRRFPWVPGKVWDQMRVTRAQAAIAVGAVGLVIATAVLFAGGAILGAQGLARVLTRSRPAASDSAVAAGP
jgi:hypothetical protein